MFKYQLVYHHILNSPQLLPFIYNHTVCLSIILVSRQTLFFFFFLNPARFEDGKNIHIINSSWKNSVPSSFPLLLVQHAHLFYLAFFFLSFSSASSFWAVFRLSASAKLSTAMAKKTFSKISISNHFKDIMPYHTCVVYYQHKHWQCERYKTHVPNLQRGGLWCWSVVQITPI